MTALIGVRHKLVLLLSQLTGADHIHVQSTAVQLAHSPVMSCQSPMTHITFTRQTQMNRNCVTEQAYLLSFAIQY